MHAANPGSNNLMRRILRCTAIIGLAYGAADLLSLVGYVVVLGVQTTPSFREPLSLFIWSNLASLAFGAVLIAGAAAMLARQSWARRVLTVWALSAIVLSSLGLAGRLIYSFAPTTTPAIQLVGQSKAYVLATSLAGWMIRAAFPLLLLSLLWQPEAREVWYCENEGFDVLPLTKPVGEAPGRQGPENWI